MTRASSGTLPKPRPAPTRAAPRAGRQHLVGTLFIAPAWVLFAAVLLLPLGVAVATSFTDSSLVSVEPSQLVGGQNYQDYVFTGSFWSSLVITVVIIVGSLVVQLPIGLGIAICLARPFRGQALFRTAITIPMMLTPVAVGLMWRFLADPDLGAIRWFASIVDGGAHPNLFASPLGAIALVIGVNSWINAPFVALLMMAALVGFPREVEEAAAIDGAGRWTTYRRIILPMLAPVIGVIAVLRGAADYRMFDLVYVITQGGPGTATRNLSMLAYQEGMVNFQIGRASSIAVAMAVLAVPAYWLYAKVVRP